MNNNQFNEKIFWQEVELWPYSYERFLGRHWYLFFLLPIFLTFFGYWLHSDRTMNGILQAYYFLSDPFVLTLIVALLFCSFAFAWWEKGLKKTFSEIIDDGILSKNPLTFINLEKYSNQFIKFVHHPLRYVFIFFFTIMGCAGATDHILLIGNNSIYNIPPIYVFAIWGYAIGAVAWCLLASAYWISFFSKTLKDNICIRPGHPDGCGGLLPIGINCFKLTIPLLIGIVLMVVWNYSMHLEFFVKIYGKNLQYLQVITEDARIFIFIFSCIGLTLAILPLYSLHNHMKEFKQDKEKEYLLHLSNAINLAKESLSTLDGSKTTIAYETFTLVRQLEPKALKISEWPFDKELVFKYSATPLASIIASIAKSIFLTKY